MQKRTIRVTFGIIATVYVLTHFFGHAHAASSLGIGSNEAMVPSTGFFGHWMHWINVQQQAFYRSLTGALKAMREDGSNLWVMVGLSAYGIFHAAGPGHGKAVISSYMLANEVALRRGVLLSFVSAFLQALTAILVMTLAFLVLRGTSVSMTDATWFLEVASYALISAFGAWLLWKKAGPLLLGMLAGNPARSLSAAHAHSHALAHAHAGSATAVHGHDAHIRHAHADHGHDHHHAHGGEHHGHDHGHGHHDHHHAAGEVCETCGHSHAPDPRMLGGDRFSWKTAWSAVAAVGLRPCSGALIVLSFAFLNGLWAGGVLSVLAMALGTAITVSVLATLAVTAKNVAVAMAGDGRSGNRMHQAIEIAGASFVLILGLLLLTASLSA